MAEISLSDYVGYIFSEVVEARALADLKSKQVALAYAQDEILQHFSVPRFKIPELELTIPVLISGARFFTTLRFVMKKEDFRTFIQGKLDNVVRNIELKRRMTLVLIGPLIPIVRTPVALAAVGAAADAIDEFYQQLLENKEAAHPDDIVAEMWTDIFWKKLEERKLVDDYKKFYSKNELFLQTQTEVTEKVKQNTAVSKASIENLLVNPETYLVKNGSDATSVFTVKAKIVEDGIFIKTIKDDKGEEKKVVEFD